MIFQMPNKKVIVPTLTIDDVNIEIVQHINFLGLILDTHLNWHKHFEKIEIYDFSNAKQKGNSANTDN